MLKVLHRGPWQLPECQETWFSPRHTKQKAPLLWPQATESEFLDLLSRPLELLGLAFGPALTSSSPCPSGCPLPKISRQRHSTFFFAGVSLSLMGQNCPNSHSSSPRCFLSLWWLTLLSLYATVTQGQRSRNCLSTKPSKAFAFV